MKKIIIASLLVITLITSFIYKDYLINQVGKINQHFSKNKRKLKVYWFIPDGFRADPDTFQLFKWANQGHLPNIKKLMDHGAYGYSIPVFPGHTPTNFATLLTGSSPIVHGIADGPMRINGYPLKMVSKSGFSSVAKKVPPIWYTLEQQGFRSSLLSVPGSTPPELFSGYTIKGRWGGWGTDFPAIIFNSDNDKQLRVRQGSGNRIFYFGSNLTKFGKAYKPTNWKIKLKSFSQIKEANLSNWGNKLYCLILDSSDNNTEDYDTIIVSSDKKHILSKLQIGQWSNWIPTKLFWETQNDYNTQTPKKGNWERQLSSISVDSSLKINLIKLGKRDFYRIRILYDGLNKFLVDPYYLYNKINKEVGPMVDFVDNYPPQLIFYPEDKKTFIDEANLSIDWHKKMTRYMLKNFNVDLIIHNIYTPNQMLTSRWWMGYLDPKGKDFNKTSSVIKKKKWNEVLNMYKGIDSIIGEIIKGKSKDTYIVLSSDHGVVPLNKEVRLNNLFAKKNWLSYKINKHTGLYQINWKKTKVVFLKMDSIYINPKGLDGPYFPATGKEYESLRNEVINVLKKLSNKNGIYPLAKVTKREDANYINLPKDRIGDLVIANKAGFGWIEEISIDLKIFKSSLKSGYKQAILPNKTKGMWTPFIISGPKIKENYKFKKPIKHIDQYPTIMKLLEAKVPDFVEGKALNEIFKD